MLHEAAVRGQHFQPRYHNFSLYGPTLSQLITFLFFFAVVNWIYEIDSVLPCVCSAEPHTHIGKKRKPMNGFCHGYRG